MNENKVQNLKLSKFQNQFMKSSFLPKYEPKIVRNCYRACSVAHYSEEILTIFGSYFGRNNDFINSFWNLLTFRIKSTAIWNILVFLGNQPMPQHQQPPPRPFFAERPPGPPRGGGGPMRGPRPNFRGSPGGNFRGSPGGHRGGPRTPYTPRGRGGGGGNFRGGPRGPRPRWWKIMLLALEIWDVFFTTKKRRRRKKSSPKKCAKLFWCHRACNDLISNNPGFFFKKTIYSQEFIFCEGIGHFWPAFFWNVYLLLLTSFTLKKDKI